MVRNRLKIAIFIFISIMQDVKFIMTYSSIAKTRVSNRPSLLSNSKQSLFASKKAGGLHVDPRKNILDESSKGDSRLAPSALEAGHLVEFEISPDLSKIPDEDSFAVNFDPKSRQIDANDRGAMAMRRQELNSHDMLYLQHSNKRVSGQIAQKVKLLEDLDSYDSYLYFLKQRFDECFYSMTPRDYELLLKEQLSESLVKDDLLIGSELIDEEGFLLTMQEKIAELIVNYQEMQKFVLDHNWEDFPARILEKIAECELIKESISRYRSVIRDILKDKLAALK